MSKKFHPKDKLLQELVSWFENSMERDTGEFFPEEDLEKIIEYYESLPHYQKAFMAVDKGIELFPYSGSFKVKKAQLLFLAKEFDQAWEVIEQALIFESNSPDLILLQADLFSAEGNYPQAIIKLKELLQVVSKNEKIDVWLEIADIYDNANQTKRLGKTLQHVLQLMPSNEEALHRYWNFVIDQETYDVGIAFYQSLTNNEPYNYLAWYYLAKCYEEVDLYEKAIEAYEYSIAINEYYFAYWDYGQCLQNVELWDRAVSNYDDMLSLFDRNSSIFQEIARCEDARGNHSEAIQNYFLAKESTNDNARKASHEYRIALIYDSIFEPLNAIRHLQVALELRPTKAKYWNYLAKIYMTQHRFEDASNCILQSLVKNNRQAKQWLKLATCYFELDEKSKVLENLYRAQLVLPEHVKINYTYAAYLLHYGHKQSGLQQLEYALSLDTTKKKYIFALFPELRHQIEVVQLCEQF